MDFIDTQYENIDFSNKEVSCSQLGNKTFKKCNFKNFDFSGIKVIEHCVFDNCDFNTAKINSVQFVNCMFLTCKFQYAVFNNTKFTHCKITRSAFTDADCTYLDISGEDWSISNLKYQSLKKLKEDMELEKLRLEMKENEIAMKLSQIKPHFLYNALIAIQVLCTEEPDTAAEATVQFANYMRENMYFINSREPIPFQRELTHIKNYVAIEKLRFQNRLTIIMDIKADNFFLPPLTIQPIIENAIKHGACKNINGGQVLLSTYETPDWYCIKVQDNGPGFDLSILEQKSDSIGIANVSFRLREWVHGEIVIKSKLNEGTTVLVRLPKEAKM